MAKKRRTDRPISRILLRLAKHSASSNSQQQRLEKNALGLFRLNKWVAHVVSYFRLQLRHRARQKLTLKRVRPRRLQSGEQFSRVAIALGYGMRKKHFALPSRAIQTSGGGPVTLRMVQAGPDQAVMEMGVDYSKAEPPDRSYYADFCDVQKARLGYSLVFGKLIPGTSKLRTKIEVNFPAEMFFQQLWRVATSEGFYGTVRKIVGATKLAALDKVSDTDKVQSFRSNNAYMGVWGEEAMIDFFYISPRDIHFFRIKKADDATLEPVVRVVMETVLLDEFLEKCRPFAEDRSRLEIPVAEVR